VAGDGTCAKPFYHMWRNGDNCNGWAVGSDGGCPSVFFPIIKSNGYWVAGDGTKPKLPYDPLKKGVGCTGYGISADGSCAKAFYHPQPNCDKFAKAANGGIPHFPSVDPRTLSVKGVMKDFKAAGGFSSTLNPMNHELTQFGLNTYAATWSDVSFSIPELGEFSVQKAAIHTAMADSLEKHFQAVLRLQVKEKLNAVLNTQKDEINKKVNFDNMIKPATNRRLTRHGRRLTQSDISAGESYTVDAAGKVAPKLESVCLGSAPAVESSKPATPRALTAVTASSSSTLYLGMNTTSAAVEMELSKTSGYPTLSHDSTLGGSAVLVADPLESVLAVFVLHGIHYSKLDDAGVIALAEATQKASAIYASVDASQVVSLPGRGREPGSCQLTVQIFVPDSKKAPLIKQVQASNAKAFESVVQTAILPLSLGAAQVNTVFVSTERIETATETITFTQLVSTTKTTTAIAPTPAPVPKVEKVSQTYTMPGLNYNAMKKDVALEEKLVNAVKEGVLSGLPAAYTKEDVGVALRAGSIIADVTITAKSGVTGAQLANTLSGAQGVAANVQSKVIAVPNLGSVLETGKKLSDVKVSATAPVAGEKKTFLPTKAPDGPTAAPDPVQIQALVTDFGYRASLQPVIMVALAIFFFQA